MFAGGGSNGVGSWPDSTHAFKRIFTRLSKDCTVGQKGSTRTIVVVVVGAMTVGWWFVAVVAAVVVVVVVVVAVVVVVVAVGVVDVAGAEIDRGISLWVAFDGWFMGTGGTFPLSDTADDEKDDDVVDDDDSGVGLFVFKTCGDGEFTVTTGLCTGILAG
jgi:hypothetical protein